MLLLNTKIAAVGLVLGSVLAFAVALSPVHLGLLQPGPMTPGHEALACVGCHRPAPGTLRQQVQAKVHHWLGRRAMPAAFGFLAPRSSDCVACHARPDDPHSPERFAEPRFDDAVRVVDARSCLGCHREHEGRRVSSDGHFCAACHDGLAVPADPLDVSHWTLVADQRWETCLGCHDYHGNHRRAAQTRLADSEVVAAIQAYLAQGPDPYGTAKKHPARDTRP